MKKHLWQLTVIACVAALAGCKPSTITWKSYSGVTYEIPYQKSAPYSFHNDQNNTNRSKQMQTEFTYVGETVAVKELNGNLTVNGRDFGSVKSGDQVRIDKSGNVSINGAPRSPK